MKDVVSRIVSGFIMAQLFPGALLVFSLSILYFSLPPSNPASLYQVANSVVTSLESASVLRNLALFGFVTGAGMFIHGLHRAVVGAVVQRSGSPFRSGAYEGALWLQILIGPAVILREIFDLLFRTKGIRAASVSESIPPIEPALVAHVHRIQDLHLDLARFFLHTAYALIGTLGSLAGFILVAGFTWRRLSLLLVLYLLTGVLFMLGRVQLDSLLTAEQELSGRPDSA